MAEDFALYRYFDSTDRLLYVGISGDLGKRDKSHINRSRWMQLATRSTIDHLATPAGVLQAERRAIENEHPLFNRQYNDTPEARERIRLYLEEIGRTDLLAATPKAGNREDRNLASREEPMPAFQPGDRVEIIKPGWKWTPVVTVQGSFTNKDGIVTRYLTDGCSDPLLEYIFDPEDLRLISRRDDSA